MAQNGHRLGFLIIESERTDGLSTRKLLLESAKHNVVTAYSGKEGVEMYKRFPNVDAVCIEDELPDLKSAAVAENIRKLNPKVRIVGLARDWRPFVNGPTEPLTPTIPMRCWKCCKKWAGEPIFDSRNIHRGGQEVIHRGGTETRRKAQDKSQRPLIHTKQLRENAGAKGKQKTPTSEGRRKLKVNPECEDWKILYDIAPNPIVSNKPHCPTPLTPQKSSYFRYLSPCHRRDHNIPMASATTYELQSSTIHAIAPGRVRFIEHQGKRILFINYSHCDVAMLKAVAEEGHRVIAQEPPNSVLTLNDVTGTSFDKESVAVLQAKVAANAPYVRKAAVIGISGLQRLIYTGVQTFSKRRLPTFENRQEALAWLVQAQRFSENLHYLSMQNICRPRTP